MLEIKWLGRDLRRFTRDFEAREKNVLDFFQERYGHFTGYFIEISNWKNFRVWVYEQNKIYFEGFDLRKTADIEGNTKFLIKFWSETIANPKLQLPHVTAA